MLKTLTYTLLAIVWGSQIPCVAGDGFGKELLRGVANTGKSKLDQSLDKTVGKTTGAGAGTAGAAAGTAGAAANKVPSAADTAGATAGTKAGTSAASTAAKPTEKPPTVTKQAEDAAKAYGEKYRNKGEQELTKLVMPKKGK